jgi:hypothetical protein
MYHPSPPLIPVLTCPPPDIFDMEVQTAVKCLLQRVYDLEREAEATEQAAAAPAPAADSTASPADAPPPPFDGAAQACAA